jgi:hypothetical protein
MKNALTDLWDDLRAKRLWPVAALLLLAVVAVPVVLTKKSETPAPTAATPAATQTPPQPDALAQVKVDQSSDVGSSLSAFDPSNPFLPPGGVVAKDENPTSGVPTGAPAGSAPSGGSAPSAGGSPSGGGSPTGGTTGGGNETGGGNQNGGGKTTTSTYTYVIDATFTASGHKRTIHGMQKLDVLPSQADPLLIFMGVTDDAGNAVFLVDATLATTGEGACKPSPSQCAFLYLGPGSEQEFTTTDGDSYSLVIDQIRKVKVGAKSSAAKAPKQGKTARAAIGAPETPHRFVVPILADLVSVSSGTESHSNSDGHRR